MSAASPTRLSLVGVSWPLFVEQLLRILILWVDQVMLSLVSGAAATGVGSGANQILFLAIIVFNFIGIGASVVITHHLGAGDRQGADRIAATAMGVNTWSGLVVSGLVAGLAPFILRLQGVPAPMFPYALRFLTLVGGTLFIDAQNLAMASVLRAHGRTRDAMLVLGTQNLLSAAGNALVLFGIIGRAHLATHGVEAVTGVALSAILSRVVAFVAFRVLVARRTGIWLRWRDYLTFPVREVRRILHIGLPGAGENLSYWVALIVVTGFVARLGPTPYEVFNFTRTVMMVVILFAISVGLGTEILVGHMVGAGAFEETYHRVLRSLRVGLALVSVATLAVLAGHSVIFRIFTDDPAVLRGCATLLLVELVIEPGRVFNIVVINSLRATGDARYPVVLGACSMWLLWVPLAWGLSHGAGLGVTGVWIAMAADEWLRAGLMYWRWRRRGWLKYARASHAHVTSLVAAGPTENA